MASLFATTERDLGSLLVEINRSANTLPDLSPEAKPAELAKGERQVAEAGELLEQLEVDVGDLSAEERNAARKRLQSYKQQLSEAEAKLKRSAVALSGGAAARNELFAYDGTSDDSRAALVTNTERLSRTTTRLDDGYRTAVETQEVAVGIMENLHTQRETIQRSRTRVRGMDTELGTSNRILSSMIARARRNKFVTLSIIAISLAIIVIIIILIATRKK